MVFEANGQLYELKYNIRALRTIEDVFQCPLPELQARFEKGIGINDLVKFFQIGLMHSNPSITVEQVDTIIDNIGIEKAAELFAAAFQEAFQKKA